MIIWYAALLASKRSLEHDVDELKAKLVAEAQKRMQLERAKAELECMLSGDILVPSTCGVTLSSGDRVELFVIGSSYSITFMAHWPSPIHSWAGERGRAAHTNHQRVCPATRKILCEIRWDVWSKNGGRREEQTAPSTCILLLDGDDKMFMVMSMVTIITMTVMVMLVVIARRRRW